MYFISHRGNITGKIEKYENSIDYINNAIKLGYDVEIDIWYLNEKLYLGHDGPQYKIHNTFLNKNKNVLWCHAKNIEAFDFLMDEGYISFFHDKDDCTLTSNGFIWTYPGKKITKSSIAVLPETVKYNYNFGIAFGICSDKIKYYKNFFEGKYYE